MHYHKQSEGDLLPAVVRKRSPGGGLLNTVERFSKRGFLLVFSVRLTSYWESYVRTPVVLISQARQYCEDIG